MRLDSCVYQLYTVYMTKKTLSDIRDDVVVAICNALVRLTSKQYQAFAHVVMELGLAELDKKVVQWQLEEM